ncbi:MAG: Zn-ribbon domain-containing OB-fold protein [Actinobacteria bacterium]|nr:Zn-ribbon domain-containing OB-fold protein [Actinomycetota bacterium]
MTRQGVRFDVPSPDNDTREYWAGAHDRRLLIQRCTACGKAFFYPRPFCPKCWSEDVATEEASGEATLYTWSVVHVNDLPPFHERVPYVAAIVDLVEGPRMMTNVVDCDFDALRVGMALRVAYRELTDDVTVPVFAPA